MKNFKLESRLVSFANIFSRQPAPLVGLDISTSSVKLVELGRRAPGQWILKCYASEQLERGWINDGQVEKFDEVVEAIRKVVRKSGTRTKNVAMALPASAVITKKLVLPGGLAQAELEAEVQSEANQYIPFSLDEVSLDFRVIGPYAQSPGEVEVLIAASRKEKVQDRQDLAEAAGLKPLVLDVESYASRLAAHRLVEKLPANGKDAAVVALFEIGAMTTSMQVLKNDELVYDRDQAFGGAQLTQRIVRQYGFSVEEAETRKRRADLPEDYGMTVLRPFVDNIVQDIARALQFFFTSTSYNRVDCVMLAGGSCVLPGMAQAVTAQTSFACRVLNPFEGMELASPIKEKKLRLEAPSYLSACGLAMRRFLQ